MEDAANTSKKTQVAKMWTLGWNVDPHKANRHISLRKPIIGRAYNNVLMLGYPKQGEWKSATAVIDGVNLMTVKFTDLQEKQFITTCLTSCLGEPSTVV